MESELATEFVGRGEVKGYKFRQIRSNDRAFMYEVTKPNGSVHFEVFERKVNTQYNNISYPNSASFGRWAWSFYGVQYAEGRFNQITENEKVQRNRKRSIPLGEV